MLTPNPEALLLKKEKINSSTRLLAATYAFKILKKQIWKWHNTEKDARIIQSKSETTRSLYHG